MPKRVGFLYEKMMDRAYIREIIVQAAKGKHHRREVRRVLADLDGYVEKAYAMIVAESYVPTPPSIREAYDPSSEKIRLLKIVPFWPDGIMHWMLVETMRPVLMRGMYHWSCASVPGRGGKQVHKYIRRILRDDPKGTKYCAELDIKQYYPSIPIRGLIWALARKIKDKRFLRVVYSVLESCGGGLAIGYYICQWLANYYLETLDHFITAMPGVKYMTRYMDNITLFGPNKKQLHRAKNQIADFLKRLRLELKGNWQIYPVSKRMVSAVGYRFARTHIILRKRNFLRFTRQCRRVKKKLDAGKPISFVQASGLLSRIGQLQHCNSHNARVKYVDPIGVRNLKEVVRYESKRRLAAQQRLLAGGAA